MPKRRLKLLVTAGIVCGIVVGGLLWWRRELEPTPSGPAFYVRFNRATRLAEALHRLEDLRVVRDRLAMHIYAWLTRAHETVGVGTYQVEPGQSPAAILLDLRSPIRQLVRMPETNWARRDARLLELHHVAPASDYLADVANPARFKEDVQFPLPKATLEGYLYPDTYDFPPLLGADEVIERRLRTFQDKVWDKIGKPADLNRIVTVASLVELEAGTDEDQPQIAGVIYNRLAKGMPLQIDASLMYALGKWRRLYFKDYSGIDSPYNLYRHKGLPPTPICSPSLKSIQAAMNPAHSNYFYYVALPGGKSLFASTYEEHQRNIRFRREVIWLLNLFS